MNLPFQPSRSSSDSDSIRRCPQPFATADLANLIEILSSCLREVASAPEYGKDDAYLNDPYCMPSSAIDALSFDCMPNTIVAISQGLSVGLSALLVRSEMSSVSDRAQSTDVLQSIPTKHSPDELQPLLMDNLGKLVGMLRPKDNDSSMPPDYITTDYESNNLAAEESETHTAKIEPPKPTRLSSLIGQLPSETLQRILKDARLASEEMACDCGGLSCPQSKSAIQRWSLSMMLVCKAWKESAMAASYQFTRLRSRLQMSSLLTAMENNADISQHVTNIDIKMPALSIGGNQSNSHAYLGSRHTRSRTQAFPWFANPPATPASPMSFARAMAPPVHDQIPIANLIDRCQNISKLELNISRASSYAYSGGNYASDFLEKGLQDSLCHASCLRTLSFRQCIDYGELEGILLAVPTLEHLRCEGGIDNLVGISEKCVRNIC